MSNRRSGLHSRKFAANIEGNAIRANKAAHCFLRVIKVVEVDTAVGEPLAETNMGHLFGQNSDLLLRIFLVVAVGKT